MLHSSEYYDAEQFHGKDVLIIGGGSSAIEIAVDLARAADSTTMSVRSDVDWVFPRHGMFGQSLRLCGAGGSAPLWFRNAAARLTFALKFGALDDYGMQPTGAPLDRRIVVSDEFYPLVKHGAIQINRGGVKSVAGDEVTFADGSTRRYARRRAVHRVRGCDAIPPHPYLKKHLEKDAKLDFYLGCFLPDVPNCSFIGGCFGFAAVPRIAELQAKAAVNVISGMSRLPSPETMRRRIKRALAFHVQKVRRSRIEIAREVSRVSNLRPISVSAARRARGRITRHPSLPPDAGESRLRFSAAVTERTRTRRERARRTRLPPLQVLVPDLDRVASISPPCRAENELFPSHSPPGLATERSSPVPPASPLPKGNTNVYTANAYYRQLMEAAGEIKSASAVDLSVKMKGAAILAAVGAVVGAIRGESDDDKTKVLAAAAAAFGLAGSALNRFGRLRGRSPKTISPLAPNYTMPTSHLLHTSDSVLSMGSMHSSNSADSTTTSPRR